MVIKWTHIKNKRRFDLINKEVDGNITEDEQVELDDLQNQMIRHRRKVAPLPFAEWEELRKKILGE
jgi:hypothetical protein